MEITLEMVERLKDKAKVSYSQAKEALEYSGGNLLDALIYLEEKGAIPRDEGAYYSTEKKQKGSKPPRARREGRRSFVTTLRRWLIDNELEIWRRDQPITALPVLILLLLLLCAFWFTLPVMLFALLFGIRYRFSGPDLEREDINNAMGSVANTAADLGHKIMEELKHDWHSDEP